MIEHWDDLAFGRPLDWRIANRLGWHNRRPVSLTWAPHDWAQPPQATAFWKPVPSYSGTIKIAMDLFLHPLMSGQVIMHPVARAETYPDLVPDEHGFVSYWVVTAFGECCCDHSLPLALCSAFLRSHDRLHPHFVEEVTEEIDEHH